MGVIYLAEHTVIERRVALKLLAPKWAGSHVLTRRLFDEARAANRASHPNLIEVTDLIQEGESCGLVMEYLAGESMDAVLHREEFLPVDRLLPIAAQIARGMAAAHEAGVIHRDLKPANVFLCERDGERDFVKILDFGVASWTESDPDAAPSLVGTPIYMAPELASSDSVDARADIYALGIIMYEALAGKPPFNRGSVRDLLVAHITEDPQPPSSLPDVPQVVPATLEHLVLRCLAKSPDARPGSMAEIAAQLERMIADRETFLRICGPRRLGASEPRDTREDCDSGEYFEDTEDITEIAAGLARSRSRWIVCGAAALIIAGLGLFGFGTRLSDGGAVALAARTNAAVPVSHTPPSAQQTSLQPTQAPPARAERSEFERAAPSSVPAGSVERVRRASTRGPKRPAASKREQTMALRRDAAASPAAQTPEFRLVLPRDSLSFPVRATPRSEARQREARPIDKEMEKHAVLDPF